MGRSDGALSPKRRRTRWARPAASVAHARRRARTTASAPTPDGVGDVAVVRAGRTVLIQEMLRISCVGKRPNA